MVSVRFGWQLLRFEWKPVAVGLLYTSYKTSLRCLFSLHPDPLDRRVTATHYTIGNRWWKELLKPLRCSSRILMCAKFKPTKMSRKQKDKQTNSNVRQWNLKKIMWLTGRSAAKFSESIWSWVCLVAFHDWLSMPRFFFFFFFFCNQSQGILGYPIQLTLDIRHSPVIVLLMKVQFNCRRRCCCFCSL